jgi:hypothetical protein
LASSGAVDADLKEKIEAAMKRAGG